MALQVIRDLALAAPWISGRTTAPGSTLKNNLQVDELSEQGRELGERIGALVWPKLNARSMTFPIVNRYDVGMEYKPHFDNPELGRFAATLFLSAPDDYDGGELCGIKLPFGSLHVYPSDSLHWVTPVTRGSRIAAIFWIS